MNNLRNNSRKLSLKFSQAELDTWLETSNEKTKLMIKSMEKIDEEQFEKFEPLVSDLRMDS